MKYENLNELLQHSSSTKRYFLTLPVEMQIAMHKYNNFIHSAEELRTHVMAEENYAHHVKISNSF